MSPSKFLEKDSDVNEKGEGTEDHLSIFSISKENKIDDILQNKAKVLDIMSKTSEFDCKIFKLQDLDCDANSNANANANANNSVSDFIRYIIKSKIKQSSFLITNLVSIYEQVITWNNELPMVQPYYAVKCNPDPNIIKLLGELNVNFDCASQGEIELVTNKLGYESDRIVYANPAKMRSHLEYAANNNVHLTVFDSIEELIKIASIYKTLNIDQSNIKLLLRIVTDDQSSICKFSNKFGAKMNETKKLLLKAKELKLNVNGVSFHVGSGCGDANAYKKALKNTYDLFQLATSPELGMMPMNIVDIGGGFPGDITGYGGPCMPSFQSLASTIRESITEFKMKLLSTPGYSSTSTSTNANANTNTNTNTRVNVKNPYPLQFIAEPGRFFVSAAVSVATQIYACKSEANSSNSSPNNGFNLNSNPSVNVNVKVEDVNVKKGTENVNLDVDVDADVDADEQSMHMNSVQALYVDNGVYGTFNNIIYDHATPVPNRICDADGKSTSADDHNHNHVVLKNGLTNAATANDNNNNNGNGNGNGNINGASTQDDSGTRTPLPSAVFGPTCDGLDQLTLAENTFLPQCHEGDWLQWNDMGAYTHTASFNFNGYTNIPQMLYVI